MTDKMQQSFHEWAEKDGNDMAHTYDTSRSVWVYFHPLTADLWDSWQTAWQAARTVPEGFVMVPVEPTDEMLEAMEQAIIDMGVDVVLAGEINKLAVWHDVLDAAPEGKK